MDRRVYDRHAYEAVVTVLPVDAAMRPRQRVFSALAKDLSQSGIRLESIDPVEASHVVIELTRPTQERLWIFARLVRCRPTGHIHDVAADFIRRLDEATAAPLFEVASSGATMAV
jgi:hypothetical protein